MAKKLTPNGFTDAEVVMRATLDPLVHTFQANFPRGVRGEVIVAGGYIRDTIVGVRPKDIDLFIRIDAEDEFERDEAVEAVAERLSEAPFYGYRPASAGNYGTNTDFSVMKGEFWSGAASGGKGAGYELDFILHDRKTVQDTLDSFDINVCKAAYVNGEFVYDPSFLEGLAEKKVVIAPDYLKSDESAVRAAKIRTRLNRVWFPLEKKKAAVGKPGSLFFSSVDGGTMWTTTGGMSTSTVTLRAE